VNKRSSRRPAFIGIDIGGTKTLGVVLNENGELLEDCVLSTPQGSTDIAELVTSIYLRLSDTVTQTPRDAHQVSSLGIGIAGLVDDRGLLHRAPNLVEADGLDIRHLVEPTIGVPVYVDNDVNCAALAEITSGAATGTNNALLVTLGTGIGGALIVDGGIYRGAFGMAGEPGHMTVNPNGLTCACGRDGCWEAYASAAGLRNLAIKRAQDGKLDHVSRAVHGDLEHIASEHITQAAKQGDVQSLAVIDEFARWVAIGLTNCAALLDPELIIVGGGLVAEWELLGDRICSSFDEMLLASDQRNRIALKPAQNGTAAGAIGASLLGRQR